MKRKVVMNVPGGKKSDIGEPQHRVTLRFTESDHARMQYWAERADCSVNEFIILMLEQWIDIQNGNYQLPSLEVQRLNQLVESVQVLSQSMGSLESIVTSGFDSLLSLTRGDNYLLEQID